MLERDRERREMLMRRHPLNQSRRTSAAAAAAAAGADTHHDVCITSFRYFMKLYFPVDQGTLNMPPPHTLLLLLLLAYPHAIARRRDESRDHR